MTQHRKGLFRNGNRWCSAEELRRLEKEAKLSGSPQAKERLKRAQRRCGERPAIESIKVRGRRWFQRLYGNTYHTAKVWVNGRHVLTVPYSYGGDRMYEDSAHEALIEAGLLPPKKRFKSGGMDVLWDVANKLGIEYDAQVENVKRKKDLHLGGRHR